MDETELAKFMDHIRTRLTEIGFDAQRDPDDRKVIQVYDTASDHYIALTADWGTDPE